MIVPVAALDSSGAATSALLVLKRLEAGREGVELDVDACGVGWWGIAALLEFDVPGGVTT